MKAMNEKKAKRAAAATAADDLTILAKDGWAHRSVLDRVNHIQSHPVLDRESG